MPFKLPYFFTANVAMLSGILIIQFWLLFVIFVLMLGQTFEFFYILGFATLALCLIGHFRATLAFYDNLSKNHKKEDGSISEVDTFTNKKNILTKNPILKVLITRIYYEIFFIKKTFNFCFLKNN